jgi:hypothetical protein
MRWNQTAEHARGAPHDSEVLLSNRSPRGAGLLRAKHDRPAFFWRFLPNTTAPQARSRAMEGTVTLLAVEQQTQRSSAARRAQRGGTPRTAGQVRTRKHPTC